MFDGMTSQKLMAILSTVEPVRLKGLALLRRRRPRPGHWLPANSNTRTLAEAAGEMIAYTQSCRYALERLRPLPPIPQAAPIEEWPL